MNRPDRPRGGIDLFQVTSLRDQLPGRHKGHEKGLENYGFKVVIHDAASPQRHAPATGTNKD
ncbi:MAG: hypothetical protein ABSC03_00175 [Verrucomicrobiota bacterium]|jgi:hypothetical protein